MPMPSNCALQDSNRKLGFWDVLFDVGDEQPHPQWVFVQTKQQIALTSIGFGSRQFFLSKVLPSQD